MRCEVHDFRPELKVLLIPKLQVFEKSTFWPLDLAVQTQIWLPMSVWYQSFCLIASLPLTHLLTWHPLPVSIQHKVPTSRRAWGWLLPSCHRLLLMQPTVNSALSATLEMSVLLMSTWACPVLHGTAKQTWQSWGLAFLSVEFYLLK